MKAVKILVAAFVVVRACGFVYEAFVKNDWFSTVAGLSGDVGRGA